MAAIEHTYASYVVHSQQYPRPSDRYVPLVQSQQWFFRQHVQEISNVTIGAILWLVLAAGQLLFVHRLLAATRSGKRWCVCSGAVQMHVHLFACFVQPYSLLRHARPSLLQQYSTACTPTAD